MVVAKNIAEEIEKVIPDKKVGCINVFDYLSSTLRNLQESYWEYLAIYAPSFYRPIHRFILWNFKSLVQERAKIVARLIQKELKKSPLVIVTTHPMSTVVGSALKKITGGRLIVVPTDYYIHRHYTASNVDLYCLPSNECFFVGVKKEDILPKSVVTGIPVSFTPKINKYEARKRLGIFDDAPVIFINFGGIGIMRPKVRLELVSLIMFCDIPCHFLLSDITNETLRDIAEFSRHFGKANCYVVNDSQLALSAANVMIGKVGGVSISDAIAYGVPVGIWTHAGPEDFNSRYLMRKSLGVKIGGFWDFLLDFPKTKKWISSPTI
jgi:UDP-N-acetylglucosamine:LPS N-acetylglucosamine transferase